MAASDTSIIEEARARAKLASDAESANREEWLDDLRFIRLEQWNRHLKADREKDPTGRRPCLVLDKCNQHIRQIVNEIRRNRPAIRVRPVDDAADVETASVLSGMIRHIENKSKAEIAYVTAVEHAVQMGRGAFRILTEYDGRASFQQRPMIAAVYNPFAVYLDTSSRAVDGSDLNWAFVMDRMPKKEFERKWPDAQSTASQFEDGYGDETAWFDIDSVRIAEYFYTKVSKEDLLLFTDGTTEWGKTFLERTQSGYDVPGVVATRSVDRRIVHWCKHTGEEILDRREFQSSYIPIIPVYGNRFIIEGEWVIMGAVRGAKDAQRAYNYASSTAIEVGALQPRAPYIGAIGQIEGLEDEWRQANYSNASILHYKAISAGGVLVPPPARQAFAGAPQGLLAQVGQAEHDIQAAFGQYQAALGAPSNEKSGVAVRERKIESDMATSHYIWNLSASIAFGGAILVELIQALETVPHVVRILGEDGTSGSARTDPRLERSTISENKAASIFNLGVGEYDVVVSVGPGYQTRRQEASENMIAMAQADPVLMQTAGDLVIRNQDWPGADAIADRRKRAIPSEIRGEDEKAEGGEDGVPPQVQQQLQQAGEVIQKLQSELAESQADASVKKAEFQLKHMELEVQQFEAELKRIEMVQKLDESRSNVNALDSQTALAGTISQAHTELLALPQALAEAVRILGSLAADIAQAAREISESRTLPPQPKRIKISRDKAGRVSGAVVVPINGGYENA